MLYHVLRNGQNYGPYTLEDLQRYVSTGNIVPTDMAKSDEMADWVPVAQILGQSTAAPPQFATGIAPPITPGSHAPYAYGATPQYPVASPYPDPPNLHWALVLLISIFTCGLFGLVWDIVQSAWMRKVNPRSNALFLYLAEFAVNFGGTAVRMVLTFSSGVFLGHGPRRSYLLGGIIFIVTLTLLELARFDMKRSMEQHYNGPEPIGLSLGPVMTFFFGSLYFQYHFTRINEMKQLARYGGAAI
jgi:hypothetical protein